MHDDGIIAEFPQQAETFNLSAVARGRAALAGLVRLATPRPDERWLEAACGPGLVTRHLAPHVLEVHGVDITPAMIEVARREAAASGLHNATFSVGDVAALDLPSAVFDGAIARFTVHHVPARGRLSPGCAPVSPRCGGLLRTS